MQTHPRTDKQANAALHKLNLTTHTHTVTVSSTSAFLERSAACQFSQAERCRPTAEQHGKKKNWLSVFLEREMIDQLKRRVCLPAQSTDNKGNNSGNLWTLRHFCLIKNFNVQLIFNSMPSSSSHISRHALLSFPRSLHCLPLITARLLSVVLKRRGGWHQWAHQRARPWCISFDQRSHIHSE